MRTDDKEQERAYGGLGNIRKCGQRPDDLANNSLSRRYWLRGIEKRLLYTEGKRLGYKKPPRYCICGVLRSKSAVDVLDGADCRAHYNGRSLYYCGSVWVCPVCGTAIRTAKSVELSKALDSWLADESHGAKFITLTIRHNSKTPLAGEFDTFSRAWRGLASGGWWKNWRESRDVVGYIRGVDITWSESNGWHLHWHLLALTGGNGSVDDFDGIGQRWIRAVNKVAPECTPTPERGCVVEDVGRNHGLGWYVNKLGSGSMAQELTQTELKSGRSSRSITPFDMLSLSYNEDGRQTRAACLFLEYARATKHRSSLRWSPGLRERLGMGREKTDDEVLEDSVRHGDVIFRLSETVYSRLLHAGDDTAVGGVLQAVEDGMTVEEIAGFARGVCGEDVTHGWTDDGVPIVYMPGIDNGRVLVLGVVDAGSDADGHFCRLVDSDGVIISG